MCKIILLCSNVLWLRHYLLYAFKGWTLRDSFSVIFVFDFVAQGLWGEGVTSSLMNSDLKFCDNEETLILLFRYLCIKNECKLAARGG